MNLIDENKYPVKYITKAYKTLQNYPTDLDILYEVLQLKLTKPDNWKISSAISNYEFDYYEFDEETMIKRFNNLVEMGYMSGTKATKHIIYEIIKTPWDADQI